MTRGVMSSTTMLLGMLLLVACEATPAPWCPEQMECVELDGHRVALWRARGQRRGTIALHPGGPHVRAVDLAQPMPEGSWYASWDWLYVDPLTPSCEGSSEHIILGQRAERQGRREEARAHYESALATCASRLTPQVMEGLGAVAEAKALEAARAHFAIDGLHLLARSWGVSVARAYAGLFPQRTVRVVLEAASPSNAETNVRRRTLSAIHAGGTSWSTWLDDNEQLLSPAERLSLLTALANAEGAGALEGLERLVDREPLVADALLVDLSPVSLALPGRLAQLIASCRSGASAVEVPTSPGSPLLCESMSVQAEAPPPWSPHVDVTLFHATGDPIAPLEPAQALAAELEKPLITLDEKVHGVLLGEACMDPLFRAALEGEVLLCRDGPTRVCPCHRVAVPTRDTPGDATALDQAPPSVPARP
jgi:pimeloyl-ACP methyl ester carboxylesterase